MSILWYLFALMLFSAVWCHIGYLLAEYRNDELGILDALDDRNISFWAAGVLAILAYFWG